MSTEELEQRYEGKQIQQAASKFGRKWAEPKYGWPCDTVMVTGVIQNFIKHAGRGRDHVEVQWDVSDSENEETMTVDQVAGLIVESDPASGNPAPTTSCPTSQCICQWCREMPFLRR